MKKVVAIDTEFERRRTYRPILSIIQIREGDKDAVVYDVYKQKNENLKNLLEILSNDDIVKIIHAARQDIEAIFYRFHISIRNVFDTQIGFKIIKHENEVGYSKLVEEMCGKSIIKEKELQKSNWLKRPLSEEQIMYAKQDVLYLHEVYYKMMDFFLDNADKYNEFKNECAYLEDKRNYVFNAMHVWQKMKCNFVNNVNYKLIKELIISRERLAYKANIPREFAIKTEHLINFAKTGDISMLKTHKKIDKQIFIKIANKYIKY